MYYGTISRYVEAEPVKGRRPSFDYRERVIVAKDSEEADKKFVDSLKTERATNWGKPQLKELVARQDIPLKNRLQILVEVVDVIE